MHSEQSQSGPKMRHALVAEGHLITTQLLDDRSYLPLEGQMAWVYSSFTAWSHCFDYRLYFPFIYRHSG